MKKHTIVIFTSNNARVVKAWSNNLDKYKKFEGVIIDPDMSKVMKIPPHFWKKPMFGNKLRVKNYFEKKAVLKSHKNNGVDNAPKKKRFKAYKLILNKYVLSAILAGGIYAGYYHYKIPEIIKIVNYIETAIKNQEPAKNKVIKDVCGWLM